MPFDRSLTFNGFGYLCFLSAARAVTLLLSPPLPLFEFTHKFRSLLQGNDPWFHWLNSHACDPSRLSMNRNKLAASHWPQVQPFCTGADSACRIHSDKLLNVPWLWEAFKIKWEQVRTLHSESSTSFSSLNTDNSNWLEGYSNHLL